MVSEEEQLKRETAEILRPYPAGRGSLIPVLQDVQAKLGYLPRSAMLEVANHTGIAESEVYAVATFYNQFRFLPPGKHPIKVCMGTSCHMKGGKVLVEAWERELGIRVGGVTADRKFSLDRVACVGCCAMAPVSVVEETVHGRVSPTRVKGILLSFNREKEEARQESNSQ